MRQTRVMTNNLARAQRFEIGGEAVEVARECIYLGQVLTPVANHVVNIIKRIRIGWTAFRRQSQMITDRLPFIPKKKKVNESCILPLLTYRAETLRQSKRVQINSR